MPVVKGPGFPTRAPKPPAEQDDGKKGLPKGPTGQGEIETPQARLRRLLGMPPLGTKRGEPARAILPPKVTEQITTTLGEDIATKIATGQQAFTPELRQQVQQRFPPTAQVGPTEPFAPTLEGAGPAFVLGKDLPATPEQAAATLGFRPKEFKGLAATRNEVGEVIGLTDLAGNPVTDPDLFDQFVFVDNAKRMAEEIWREGLQNQAAIAASTLDPAGIQAAQNVLSGIDAIMTQFNTLTNEIETISQQRTFTVNEFNAAVAMGDLNEAIRHNRVLEGLDQRRLELQEQEQRLGLLAVIAQNPAILFFAKQTGMLGQFADLGIDIEALSTPVSSRVNIQYLTKLKQVDPAAYKQAIFALQVETGMSEQEVLTQLAAQSPGVTAGRPTQRTL